MQLIPGDFIANVKNAFKPALMKKMMWASGTSIVFIVKIDKSKIPRNMLTKFRDHIDLRNQHVVRLGEKEVVIDGKPFQFFALHTTGGGHFPT